MQCYCNIIQYEKSTKHAPYHYSPLALSTVNRKRKLDREIGKRERGGKERQMKMLSLLFWAFQEFMCCSWKKLNCFWLLGFHHNLNKHCCRCCCSASSFANPPHLMGVSLLFLVFVLLLIFQFSLARFSTLRLLFHSFCRCFVSSEASLTLICPLRDIQMKFHSFPAHAHIHTHTLSYTSISIRQVFVIPYKCI